MAAPAPASEVERRKQLRIRLRPDLSIDEQRYEGRKFYVVKDPVSLRYYRLKDNEHFLLKFLDGKHTLEDAQKAYEREYRPERLKLEDLEGFAQQLLTAGLAISDSPKAGKQLYERKGKRQRREWMQYFTNILYIKIPIFDPEWILQRMLTGGLFPSSLKLLIQYLFVGGTLALVLTLLLSLVRMGAVQAGLFGATPPAFIELFSVGNATALLVTWLGLAALYMLSRGLGFLFSNWFFILSVIVMGAAVLLVATHFDTFRRKMPDFQEFFTLKSIAYLYVSLAVVKVIHEFGHGLSCKRFGGEVHEMGALLMCFSPALYCNVSDAWVLPNKWHRIIISFAGIYVELLIAAIATFVWWYTPTQPFINNLALHLMVVCSVSTIVFNANPLMRYDGYYVLADWIEIPNLREKANRYLSNLFSEVCLGIEVPPEEYMDPMRKAGFIFYAVVSYLYRWMVTFGILLLFYTFLKPYKLEVIGNLLTVAAILSMTIWPTYQMAKNIYRRGRLPDMKRTRVLITLSVFTVLLGVLFLVPVPISRVRGLALVQPPSDQTSSVPLRRTAVLREVKAQVGDQVVEGQVLAIFRDPDLEERTSAARTQLRTVSLQLRELEQQKSHLPGSLTVAERQRYADEIAKVEAEETKAKALVASLERTMEDDLTLKAPRSGVVGQAPKREDVGKLFEGAREQAQVPPVFTVHAPGKYRLCLPLESSDYNQLRQSLVAARKAAGPDGEPRPLDVIVRVHGRDSQTWRGRIERLEESEAKFVPLMLSSRAGGPVAVKAPSGKSQGLVPQTQHFLVYIDLLDADESIAINSMAQVKIYCQPETVAYWCWRKLNNMLNIRLM